MAKANPTTKAGAPEDQGSQPDTQAPATAGAAPGNGEVVDVRVLAAVTIAGERFQPDDVIEGVPVSVAESHAGSVDAHPDAVAYARSIGSPVYQYEAG